MLRGGIGAAVCDDHDRPVSSPRSAFCTRDVHFALENDGWNCTFECEVHLSASRSAQEAVAAVHDDHGGYPRGPVRSSGCPSWSQSDSRPPFPEGPRRKVVQICCKGSDRAGAREKNR